MATWVRVRDTATGHQFDVDERSLRYGLERLNDERYPDLTGRMARPRPPRTFVGKDGRAATPGPVTETPGTDTEGARSAPELPRADTGDGQPAAGQGEPAAAPPTDARPSQAAKAKPTKTNTPAAQPAPEGE